MEKKKKGLFGRLRQGLRRTSEGIVNVTTGRMRVDDAMLEELEEALILADVGMPTAMKLVDGLREAAKKKEITKPDEVRPWLRKQVAAMVTPKEPFTPPEKKPLVILMIGVNGAGKTTTIGKLAHRYKNEGKDVMLAAGDTFRAAAIDQLDEWAKRTGLEIIKHHPNSDPAAVAFDAMKASIARGKDVVIIDTAGRLHTRSSLMEQMKKLGRVIDREMPGAPHETLLVLDGTTGQNGLHQVQEFNQSLTISGLVITKLDGSAKGGALVGIVQETGIPARYVGVGEKIEDLQPFDPEAYAEALIPD